MKKIMLVFGTRPEAIKMTPLVLELGKYPEKFSTTVCVTGQHRQMLDSVLRLFGIVPDYDLDIMQPGQDLFDVTARVLTGMRDVLDEAAPDAVLVHGDTTTSTAAALAAFYRRIPVGHVEAGLRTRNPMSPWPEEMNRQITGRIASIHFAPTTASRQNLLDEGIAADKIHVTGNTVIDALQMVTARLAGDTDMKESVMRSFAESSLPADIFRTYRRIILVTGHRRENFGEGFDNICHAIRDIAQHRPDTCIVYPMHLNPNVRQAIEKMFGTGRHPMENVFFTEPLDYLPFVYLMERSHLVLTDSGGIQEEAPGLGKPVLVMRDTTERPEAVEAGTVKLVGTDRDRITAETFRLLDDNVYYNTMSRAVNPYGDGKACARIAEILHSTNIP